MATREFRLLGPRQRTQEENDPSKTVDSLSRDWPREYHPGDRGRSPLAGFRERGNNNAGSDPFRVPVRGGRLRKFEDWEESERRSVPKTSIVERIDSTEAKLP